MKSFFVKTAAIASLSLLSSAESIYNPIKSSVTILNPKNFDKQVTLNREKGISVVQYYKASGKSLFSFLISQFLQMTNPSATKDSTKSSESNKRKCSASDP